MNRKTKRKEKGMTLLEVLLALILSSLFFLYAGQFLAIGTTIFTKIKTQQELRFAMNQVIRTFEEQYEEAVHLCVYIGRPNESLKVLTGCEQGLHEQKLEEGDYTQYFLYAIDYYMPDEMDQDHQQNGSKEVKTSIELREHVKSIDKNRQPYFNMIFQTQAVIPHDLTIEVDVKEEYLILKITLFKNEEYYLEDQLRLDLRYKL